MQNSLTCLPYDLIVQIATALDLRSFVNFSRVCRRIHGHLQNDGTARRCLQVSVNGDVEEKVPGC